MEGRVLTYLLDTAVWINGITMPESLPRRIRAFLESEERIGLCSVSLLEAAILFRLGRLEFEGSLEDLFTSGLSADLHVIELSPAIASATNDLPKNFQGDPFDRTIVATAAVLNLTLITTDAGIRDTAACALEYYPFRPTRSKK